MGVSSCEEYSSVLSPCEVASEFSSREPWDPMLLVEDASGSGESESVLLESPEFLAFVELCGCSLCLFVVCVGLLLCLQVFLRRFPSYGMVADRMTRFEGLLVMHILSDNSHMRQDENRSHTENGTISAHERSQR